MSNYLGNEFVEAINKEIIKHAEYLASGKAESFERYHAIVGKITGLKDSVEVYKRCLKRRGEDDDE